MIVSLKKMKAFRNAKNVFAESAVSMTPLSFDSVVSFTPLSFDSAVSVTPLSFDSAVSITPLSQGTKLYIKIDFY